MAKALKYEQLTPADELRILLAESEKMVVSLRGRGADAKEILEDMDRIAALWPQLEAAGVDLRAEAGRWETLQANLRANGWTLLRELSTAGGLAAVRREEYGDARAPEWWYLDEELGAQRKKKATRSVVAVAAVIGAVLLAYLAFTRLFPADPNVQAAFSAIIGGQQKVQELDLEGALSKFEEATRLTPNDPEAWAWVSAIQTQLGRTDDAARSGAILRGLTKDEVTYHIQLAQAFAGVGMNEQAASEAQAALALDPESPEAHFSLAGAYESLGQIGEAINHMELASTYAEARGKNELTVIARYRLAMMLQAGSLMVPPTATPEAE
jgi:tetratricopeptide (TPR) repeat protein